MSKNLKKYSKKYEVEDEEAGQATSAAEVERRRGILEEWRGWQAEWSRAAEDEAALQAALWKGVGGGKEEEEEYKAEEVEVEEIIDVREEIMSFEG